MSPAAAIDVTTVRVFGIRHHGPGSARSLRRALAQMAPDVILVEGPPEADAVVALAADPELTPPVALLAYAPDHLDRAVFYPFASFSPEWQAIRHGVEHDVPVRFADLPLTNVLAEASADARRGAAIDPIAVLAEAAGYRDPERWWDDRVEHQADHDAFAEIAAAMAAVRGADRPLTTFEARREAAMRERIRKARKDGFARIAVVCGAWHAPVLDAAVGADLTATKAGDRELLTGLTKVKVTVTWVPWTHQRLTFASGYGAGVTSPGWYDHLFTHAGAEVVARWFARCARLLREADHRVSPDHVIAATRLAEALAAVRGRPLAGLDEVEDATVAVLTDGAVSPLSLVRERLLVGDRLGTVPAGTPMVPVARDLATQQRRARLKPEALVRTLELDLRQPLGRLRSQLLHRLVALDVPWGVRTHGRGSTGSFRETWRLQWQPELAVRLVEASAHGTTVEHAATGALVARAARTNALADLTAVVELALLAELHDAVIAAMDRVSAAAAVDHDVTHLMDALGPLAQARRYGDVRGTDTASLDQVLDGLVTRIVAGLGLACSSLDEDMAAAMADRLTSVQASLALLGRDRDASGWSAALAQLARQRGVHGVVTGRATRLLLDAEVITAADAGNALGRALSYGTPPAAGAAFVEGLLAGSGTVLLHDATLRRLLDDWLCTLADDDFVDVLPLLRRTTGSFEPSERRRLGDLITRPDRSPPAAGAMPLDDARVIAALRTVRLLLGDREHAASPVRGTGPRS